MGSLSHTGKTEPFKRLLFLGTISLVKHPNVYDMVSGCQYKQTRCRDKHVNVGVEPSDEFTRCLCSVSHTVRLWFTGIFGELQQEHECEASQPACESEPRRTVMLWRCSAQQGVIECSVFLCLRPAACVHRGGVTVSQSY